MFDTGLTPAETERLALLMEEMAEASQIIGKILRHGYASHNPTVENSPNNRQLLEKELGDVQFALNLMARRGDIRLDQLKAQEEHKARVVMKYLHHQ